MASVLALALAVGQVAQAQGNPGVLQGRVTNVGDGSPVAGVRVTVSGPEEAPASARRSESQTTDAQGTFSFGELPAGTWSAEIAKDGFRTEKRSSITVRAGQANRTDVAMESDVAEEEDLDEELEPAAAAAEAGSSAAPGTPAPPGDVEEFIVVAPPAEAILSASRMEADQLINTLSAEEFAKFAAGDVAAALKFVPGVSVVEGQFAVIRGLEDRYSSTLFNHAPVPSPDPDAQSVQLDLFPSDVVRDLVVSKTFAPESPSNSSGGGLDIITIGYPETFEIKVSSSTGGNPYAADRFIRFDRDSPIGTEVSGWDNVIESDYNISLGGQRDFFDRNFRIKGLIGREIDFDTAEGTREGREPIPVRRVQGRPQNTGDLSLGELNLSSGLFDLIESERQEQKTIFGAFGFDLDEEGDHKIDFTAFYTKKEDETVEQRENGFFPGFDYTPLVQSQLNGEPYDRQRLNTIATFGAWIARGREEQDTPERGPLWYTSFYESRSFERDRDLRVFQLNGDHTIAQVEGLKIRWAMNKARTTQEESARGLRYQFEPDDLTIVPGTFPVQPDTLGDGSYTATNGFRFNNNSVEEKQRFGRVDGEYEIPFDVPKLDEVVFKISAGGWYEKADRDVIAEFLDGAPRAAGQSQLFVEGANPDELGDDAFPSLILDPLGRPQFTRDATNEASRTVKAWNVGGKLTFFERLDLLGGIRREEIQIVSDNDPFTGFNTFTGAPGIFPSAYLFFDRLDNPSNGEGFPIPGIVYNDQIIGIDVPVNPVTGFVDLRTREEIQSLVNGRIDEKKLLPSASFSYRPIEGLNLRGAYSRTVARPSFRELGYYATVEPGTDDVTVGNPQLGLSDVESYDLRAEYSWGDYGDLAAVSLFRKRIDDPIEVIVLRDAANAEFDDSGLFRTFFNNPNQAKLRGVEVEARKNLGVLPYDWAGFLEYFSIGGNFSYIDAEVERTEAELARANLLFGALPGAEIKVQKYEKKRRLYNQPEWIANADITFDQPDWGTKITVSYYAISSILDAAGVASVDRAGIPRSFTLDRYIDGFYQVDIVATQRIWQGLVLKASVKNVTNSTREVIYDEAQTVDQIAERTLKVGRDFSIGLSYTFEF